MNELTGTPEVHVYVDEPPDDVEVWWRARVNVQTRTVSVDEFDAVYSYRRLHPLVTIWVEAHRVLKVTPKGVWLDDSLRFERRFVRREATKRWACPTPEEALESLYARQRRRLGILTRQVEDTSIAVNELEKRETWTTNPKVAMHGTLATAISSSLADTSR